MIQIPKVAHRTIKVRDLDVFYREAGSKDAAAAVLLLHGFPTSSHLFRNLIPALADRYRVLAPDYPGFGHSSIPTRATHGPSEVFGVISARMVGYSGADPDFRAMILPRSSRPWHARG
jgi:pimeloyl-ACP methyl ester carboxylesterase